jgi:hypothetical protein
MGRLGLEGLEGLEGSICALAGGVEPHPSLRSSDQKRLKKMI